MAVMTNAGRDVNALRREKEAALLSMGKVMHKLVRDGMIADDNCTRINDRIAQIDAEICAAEGGRVPDQGAGICPNCGGALASPMAAFCGACGTNVTEFYARNTANCARCGQLTQADGRYCVVCGALRLS